MKTVYTILHSIPGRIRLHIPALANQIDHTNIEKAFGNLQGFELVTIQPITKSMTIKYDHRVLQHIDVIRFVQLFFSADSAVAASEQTRDIKKDIQHTLFSGVLLLASYYRKNTAVNANMLDYFMVATTTYTVSSRGDHKLTKPDMIKALVSMFSSGTSGVLQSALVVYILNIVQLAGSVKRQPQLYYAV